MAAVDSARARKAPIWFWLLATFGVLWNVYGAYQLIGSFSQTRQSLMAVGMTASQADLYLSLPAWLSVVFAIGVAGGLVGSVFLILRKAIALPVFLASLIGYLLLFIGDVSHGVFANIPSQLAILAFVVIVAVILLWTAWFSRNRGLLSRF